MTTIKIIPTAPHPASGAGMYGHCGVVGPVIALGSYRLDVFASVRAHVRCGVGRVDAPVISLGSYGLNVFASLSEVLTCGVDSVEPGVSDSSPSRPLASASTYHSDSLP